MSKNSSPLISKLRNIAGPDKDGKDDEPRAAPQDEAADGQGTEHCDFCSKPIPPDHRHFADLDNMKFMCACEMCTIMQAEKGEYQQIPQRYKYLDDFMMPDSLWNQLKIPVNMAFFVYNGEREQPIAFYPGPAGATESELHLDAWDDLKDKNPSLNDLTSDLEGFLINRLDEPHEYFIVPIDTCYELIGLIRMTWEGLHGGDKMRNQVRAYFSNLKLRCD